MLLFISKLVGHNLFVVKYYTLCVGFLLFMQGSSHKCKFCHPLPSLLQHINPQIFENVFMISFDELVISWKTGGGRQSYARWIMRT
jgi:pyruvate-formate lyase-activating enzyme